MQVDTALRERFHDEAIIGMYDLIDQSMVAMEEVGEHLTGEQRELAIKVMEDAGEAADLLNEIYLDYNERGEAPTTEEIRKIQSAIRMTFNALLVFAKGMR